MDRPPLPARDRILLAAHDLFYQGGIRATGIDRIIAQSGVAKLTFYRHFPGKDDLVRAFLDYRHGLWMAWFVDALGRHGASPGGGLAPVRAALAEWFAEPGFRGCAFINAVAEAGAGVPGALEIARNHKAGMRQLLADLLPAGAQQAVQAQAAALAVDGAIVVAQMGDTQGAMQGLDALLAALAPVRSAARRTGPRSLTTRPTDAPAGRGPASGLAPAEAREGQPLARTIRTPRARAARPV